MISFPKHIETLLYTINEKGYEAFCVGGCVRDALLGMESKDIDITTNAPMEVLTECFLNYKPIIFEKFGALSFNLKDYNIEITRFRKESGYKDGRHPDAIEFDVSLKQDLLRRDFTINALIYHPEYGVVDWVDGLSDIENRQLRTIGDPKVRFNEDYLRMLRLIRFASQLDFTIEIDTWDACVEDYYKVSHLSKYQWREEFFKYLNSYKFLDMSIEYPWILGVLIPELYQASKFDQLNDYHKYSLYEHTIRVTQLVESNRMKVAALFHDLGKLKTQVIRNNGRASYRGHAIKSVVMVLPYLEYWNFSEADKKWIKQMIEFHDVPIETDYISIKKCISKWGYDFTKSLIEFKRADNIAKSDKAMYQVERCEMYEAFLEKYKIEKPAVTLAELDIKGDELHLEPKLRSHVLDLLLIGVIEERLENKKEVLLTEVERIKNDLY